MPPSANAQSEEPAASSNGSGPGGPAPRPALKRYAAMPLLTALHPLPPEDFAPALAAHQEFLQSGGAGGRWETVATSADLDSGIVIGVYLDAKASAGEQADFGHQRLEGLDLRGVHLPYADLTGCICPNQDLGGANLAGSLCTDADFSRSSFEGANLAGADFSRTELPACNFRSADLTGADFEDADLTGADLRGAKVEGARFVGAAMEGVKRDGGV